MRSVSQKRTRTVDVDATFSGFRAGRCIGTTGEYHGGLVPSRVDGAAKGAQAPAVAAKRRLPVLPAEAPSEEPVRSPLQWNLFGGALIVLTWLVLALLLTPVWRWYLNRAVQEPSAASPTFQIRMQLELISGHLVALGTAAFAGGYVVGRWGPRRWLLESAVPGAIAAVAAVLLTLVTGAPEGLVMLGAAVIIPTAAISSLLGGLRGRQRHDKA
jgi:predicted MFS family arabinose efflux permease